MKKKMVGVGRVVIARRERMMMLEPFGKGIMGTLLLYPYEIRSEEAVFEEIPDLKLPEQMVGLVETIIDKMNRLRAGEVRGPLRKRDDCADPVQAGRSAGTQRESSCWTCQRCQSNGCAASRVPTAARQRPPRLRPRRQKSLPDLSARLSRANR